MVCVCVCVCVTTSGRAALGGGKKGYWAPLDILEDTLP